VPSEIHELVDSLESILKKAEEKSQGDMGLTAQVSIYSLRQANLSMAINEALKIFNEEGLEVEPGSMSTLIAGSDTGIWKALQKSFSTAAALGETVMIVTVSNACPWPLHTHP